MYDRTTEEAHIERERLARQQWQRITDIAVVVILLIIVGTGVWLWATA